MLFVCYPKCTTCQKAKAWLEGRGLTFDVRDIKTDRPTEAELRQCPHLKQIALMSAKTEQVLPVLERCGIKADVL